MNVVVAGGTGFIGTRLCRELATRNVNVTALSRSGAAAELPASVGTATADVTEYEGLPAVLEGADVVVNLVALSPLYRPRGGEERQQTVHVGATRNLVRAATECGIPKIVQMSGLGADTEAPTAHLRAKGQAEGVVTAADRDWVILRPSVVVGEGDEFIEFIQRVTTPYVTALPGGGRTQFQPIWVGDLVELVATAITDGAHDGEVYELGGPEVHSLAAVTRLYYEMKGQSVRIVPIPMPLAKVGFTIAKFLPLVPFGPDQYRALGVKNTVSTNDITAFDRQPADLTTLEEHLERRLA